MEKLSDKILVEICMYLKIEDIIQVCLTCKTLNALLMNKILWPRLYNRDFGKNFWHQDKSTASSSSRNGSQDNLIHSPTTLKPSMDSFQDSLTTASSVASSNNTSSEDLSIKSEYTSQLAHSNSVVKIIPQKEKADKNKRKASTLPRTKLVWKDQYIDNFQKVKLWKSARNYSYFFTQGKSFGICRIILTGMDDSGKSTLLFALKEASERYKPKERGKDRKTSAGSISKAFSKFSFRKKGTVEFQS